MSEFGVEAESPSEISKDLPPTISPKEIKLYFDPATQKSFKNAITSSIDKMVSKIETQSIYAAFQKELGDEEVVFFEDNSFISFREVHLQKGNREVIPNSTQHNVPAWTLFAIFFIVIPLSINIVKEKNQGTSIRLYTNPVSYLTILGGKIITYLVVCTLQFSLMLALGAFLFPFLGLPALTISDHALIPLFSIALFSGLAAIGFGILLGTVATTPEQAAPFGATSVVILAAIGGIWVPVFLMPKLMQWLSNISPMNWGLMAFYDVLLRKNGWTAIFPELCLLLFFFIVTISISVYYDKKQKAV